MRGHGDEQQAEVDDGGDYLDAMYAWTDAEKKSLNMTSIRAASAPGSFTRQDSNGGAVPFPSPDVLGAAHVVAGKKEGVARVEEEAAGVALWRGKGGEALVVVRGHAMCVLSSYGEENDRRTRWVGAAKAMGRSWAGHFGLESSFFSSVFSFFTVLIYRNQNIMNLEFKPFANILLDYSDILK